MAEEAEAEELDGAEDGVEEDIMAGDIMAEEEEICSTTQPISKITTHLMYTFIRHRPPTQPVSTTICDGSLGTDKPT